MTVTQDIQPEVEAPAEAVVEAPAEVVRKVADLTPVRGAVEPLIAAFNAAKQAERDAKAAKAAAEADLRTLLGDAEAIVLDGVERVQVKHGSNTNYLEKVLVEAFPEAAEASRNVTPYTFLKAV